MRNAYPVHMHAYTAVSLLHWPPLLIQHVQGYHVPALWYDLVLFA